MNGFYTTVTWGIWNDRAKKREGGDSWFVQQTEVPVTTGLARQALKSDVVHRRSR